MIGYTEEQKERFVIHLTECHSWYKHISLIQGGEFVLVLDKKAGLKYPLNHPKLPFGNSIYGYQKAFGHLTYFWKTNGDQLYFNDYETQPYTKIEIEKKYKFLSNVNLFPYISNDFNEAINYLKSDFENIIQNEKHLETKTLKTIYNLSNSLDFLWQNELNNEERDCIISENININNAVVSKYLSMEKEMFTNLEILKNKEIEKLKMAINKIKNCN